MLICEIRGKEEMPTIPFQKIKDGTIPHVKNGGVYYINVPALMETLGTTLEGHSKS